MKRCYCIKCERFYSANELDNCPYCEASTEWQEIDDIEPEEWEPTEEDIEAMYEDYLTRFADDCETRGGEGAQ